MVQVIRGCAWYHDEMSGYGNYDGRDEEEEKPFGGTGRTTPNYVARRAIV